MMVVIRGAIKEMYVLIRKEGSGSRVHVASFSSRYSRFPAAKQGRRNRGALWSQDVAHESGWTGWMQNTMQNRLSSFWCRKRQSVKKRVSFPTQHSPFQRFPNSLPEGSFFPVESSFKS